MRRISYQTRRARSIQQNFCPIPEVDQKAFRLQVAGIQEWLAVLEVQGLGDSLRSEGERYRLNEHFLQILVSLPHPIQILLRILPTDQECALPSLVLTHSQEAGVLVDSNSAQQRRIETGTKSSTSHIPFIKNRISHQTLLERHVYLVIPALADNVQEETGTTFAHVLRSQSQGEQSRALQEAWYQLTIRCQDLERRLSAMSLITHRLSNDQLIELAYSCLRPQEALINPLHTSWIKGVFRLVRQAIEEDCVQMLDIHTLPREVAPEWFSQLLRIDEVMDISLFSLPQASAPSMRHFERHTRTIQNQNYPDPERVAMQEDIEQLMECITVGHDRVLQFAVHVLIRGKGRREMYTRSERIRTMLSHMQPGSPVASFKQEKGVRSCLRYTRRELWTNRHPRLFGSYKASSIFPFLSQTLFEANGTL